MPPISLDVGWCYQINVVEEPQPKDCPSFAMPWIAEVLGSCDVSASLRLHPTSSKIFIMLLQDNIDPEDEGSRPIQAKRPALFWTLLQRSVEKKQTQNLN
jgi:hypothetical protein